VCAKYGLSDASDVPDAETWEQLREFLRRGLVAYVGAANAEALAAECLTLG
jgi:aryl-alcohol dehydrogenase-like predicted oxidoreductase